MITKNIDEQKKYEYWLYQTNPLRRSRMIRMTEQGISPKDLYEMKEEELKKLWRAICQNGQESVTERDIALILKAAGHLTCRENMKNCVKKELNSYLYCMRTTHTSCVISRIHHLPISKGQTIQRTDQISQRLPSSEPETAAGMEKRWQEDLVHAVRILG